MIRRWSQAEEMQDRFVELRQLGSECLGMLAAAEEQVALKGLEHINYPGGRRRSAFSAFWVERQLLDLLPSHAGPKFAFDQRVHRNRYVVYEQIRLQAADILEEGGSDRERTL